MEELYIWGFPLVLTDATRRSIFQSTDLRYNQLLNINVINDLSNKFIVRPNTDTYYSVAFLNLENHHSVKINLPENPLEHYYLFQFMDMWTDVFYSTGLQHLGKKGMTIVISHDELLFDDADVKYIHAATSKVWLVVRIMATKGALELQKRISLDSLPALNLSKNSPPLTEPLDQVLMLKSTSYFNILHHLAKQNLRNYHDCEAFFELSKMIAICPSPSINTSFIVEYLTNYAKHMGRKINNWQIILKDVGVYGDNYTARAAIALLGLAANKPQDAIYMNATHDVTSVGLNGHNEYEITFNELPPSNPKAFWSLTIYLEDGYLYNNPQNKYSIHSFDKYNKQNGKVTFYLSHDKKGANVLPIPLEDFSVVMRIYWPKDDAFKWVPPGITLVSSRARRISFFPS
ncbi:MAG: hypothetical protein Harvfovirus15_5 [Harvfovirus sp.]|uniref:DUF1214 domain-containing protein n=1 Tax=Harvfovirus sp. TaxID=2487768 RepID=A0A3G5A4B8_9VIRU|nr:MAG: hypothetical protein Harvfovirus15_5 [Harvfovirus sp.]